MNSGAKILVLLFCIAAIGGLFLPQIKVSSKYFDSEEEATYIKLGEEAEGRDQSLGITIIVLVVIAIVLILLNANILSLLALTAGGTLVIYNAMGIIRIMNEYKKYSDSLSGMMDVHYGLGFYLLPASILFSAFIVLFNLNTQNDYGYTSSISYSSLSNKTLNQSSNYNTQHQPVIQPSYSQPNMSPSLNNGYQPVEMHHSTVNTDIFNQAPVASTSTQTESSVNNIQPNTNNVI